MIDGRLYEQLLEFAETTNRALSTVGGEGNHVEVEQGSRSSAIRTLEQGVLLTASNSPVLRLSARFVGQWSNNGEFMAIEHSSIKVLPVTTEDLTAHGLAPENKPSAEPVVRIDYERNPRAVPASHINIHSHHPWLQWIQTLGHPKSRSVKNAPRTEALHFPTGGHRFRPSLEDVIEALVDDFTLDIAPGGRATLHQQRASFRERQLAAAVGDDPETAARALRRLGYVVTRKPYITPPDRRGDRLEAL